MALLSKLISKRSQGSIYEQKARAYLESQGLKFVAANQQFKCGELDLVMLENDTLVFVEVRQRKSNRFGSAVESIDYRKQQKWLNAANMWLLTKRKQSLDTAKCRFDVVAFEGDNPPLWLPNFLG
nr:YraN family protein [uncultured Haemophilus sp.]